jgi:hypothetical protein
VKFRWLSKAAEQAAITMAYARVMCLGLSLDAAIESGVA